MSEQETITAIATPPGYGGVGIVRVSGPAVCHIATEILGGVPEARRAEFANFRDGAGLTIDGGIALFFLNPSSFTGEDILELQGHGGPVVMDLLLQRVLELGARLAHPGEFSQRAFLNGKLDLAQAEAIADLIESGTTAAARLAVRSLAGDFSDRIHTLVFAVTQLRMYVEAAIDFPEEEIDFLADGKVSDNLHAIQQQLADVEKSASVGRLLRDGLTLVIAGPPNAGKSSIMNGLSGRDTAIVTSVPGTTRDLLKEQIQIDGLPLHLIDTAGLRESADPVEQEGMRRAREQIANADRVLWVFDDQADLAHAAFEPASLPEGVPVDFICNKIDLTGTDQGIRQVGNNTEIAISAHSDEGISLLREYLKQSVGFHGEQEGEFLARRRHLDALERASQYLHAGELAMQRTGSGELLAEDLRQAQMALSEITGEFTADDLLGEIFSSFCIGK
ncbi:MAG: tRNA uridine-5-carboxymethylaminomethyl(34) synthesis GTPase MnmE [Gammaproteobacteria bacterium]|nr:tRNA uridine-5-carboxymethylaminomethyl(34) synthesis GTPase MnmE [Gammaproteobacteria bacterium]